MLQQDDMSIKHFLLKDEIGSQLGLVKAEKAEIEAERDQYFRKTEVMEESYRSLMNKSPSELEARVVEVTKRLCVREGESLKLERKYKLIS